MNYQIISDSSCDLPEELATAKHLHVVPFYVSFDSKNYLKENVEIKVRDFYQKMVDYPRVYPKSSMPSVADYYNAFYPYVKENIPIICICITTKFSGSMQSAVTAKMNILEELPDAVITVIDATVNTVLQGIYVLEALKMQEQGVSYEDNIVRLEEIKSTGRIFFTVGSIDYLKHGGRIGKLAGLAGSVLGIKPIITLKEGEIFPSAITRNRKKSMEKVLELLFEYLKETKKPLDTYSLCIGYGYDYEEAGVFRSEAIEKINNKLINPRHPFTEQDLPLYQIGSTIGVHTGPYPLGFGIVEKA